MPESGRRKCFEYDRKEVNQLAALFCLFTALSAISAIINDQWILIDGHNLDEIGDESFFLANAINVTNSSVVLEPIDENIGQVVPCTNIGARLFWIPASFESFVDDERDYDSYRLRGNIVLINCISPAVAFYFYLAISFCFVVAVFSFVLTILHCFVISLKFVEWLKRYVILEVFCAILTPVICVLTFAAKCEVQSMRPKSKVSLDNGIFYIVCAGLFSITAAVFSLHQQFKLKKIRRVDNQKLICGRTLRSWRQAIQGSPLPPRTADLERYLLNPELARPSTSDSVISITQNS